MESLCIAGGEGERYILNGGQFAGTSKITNACLL